MSDLTRYRIEPIPEQGLRYSQAREAMVGLERLKDDHYLVPDVTLQQIADAWIAVANCGPEATLQEWNAAQDNLNAQLIGLVEGDEDE